MKSFNIDRKMKDLTVIEQAIRKVCKGKKKRNGKPTTKYKQAQRILACIDKYVTDIYTIVCQTEAKQYAIIHHESVEGRFPKAFVPRKYSTFQLICDNGKQRDITNAKLYPDQIIHQLIVDVSKEVFMGYMYNFSCGSVPGGGTHKGVEKIKKYIKNSSHKFSSHIKYAAQLDVKRCFKYVNHEKLKAKLRKKFRGYLFLLFCNIVIDSYLEPNTEQNPRGLPIGFVTSPWWCNFYMSPIDYYITQVRHANCYIRYIDNKSFFGNNKKEVHKTVDGIIKIAESLGMLIKDDWQVFRFDYISPKCRRKDGRRGRALDALGFRFFRDKTILRKHTALKIRRMAKKIYKSKTVDVHTARSFMSRIGQLRHCNSKRFWLKYVKPYVNIKKLKEIIRNADRKQYIPATACCK